MCSDDLVASVLKLFLHLKLLLPTVFCQRKYHCENDINWRVNTQICRIFGIDIDKDDLPPRRTAAGNNSVTRVGKRKRTCSETVGSTPRRSTRIQQQSSVAESNAVGSSISGRNESNMTTGGEDIIRDQAEQPIDASANSRDDSARNENDSGEGSRFSQIEESQMPLIESFETDNEIINGQNVDDFLQFAKKASSLFCIRQFTRHASETPPGSQKDKYGTKPSEWCVTNSYCASSGRILAALGISDGQEAIEKLRETSIDVIKESCRQYGRFGFAELSEGNLGRYCASYKRFACMKKGDIVAMLIRGPTRKGKVYFGVITSNNLKIMSPDQAKEKNFPAPHLFELKEFDGLMLREVRWMRTGYMRHLPGQQEGRRGAYTVPWLAESSPFWLLNSKKGLDVITGTDTCKDFLQSTEQIS